MTATTALPTANDALPVKTTCNPSTTVPNASAAGNVLPVKGSDETVSAERVKHQAALDNAVVSAMQTDPSRAQAMLRSRKSGSDVAALVGKQATYLLLICLKLVL